MNSDYKYKDVPLTNEAAKELLIELYDGKAFIRNDAAVKVLETHLERGGLDPTVLNFQRDLIKPALSSLKHEGVAQNPVKSMWRIATDKNTLPEYKYAGMPITSGMAKELIIELFDGKVFTNDEACESVLDLHLERGGLHPINPNLKRGVIKSALVSLKRERTAYYFTSFHWRVATDKSKMPEYKYEGIPLVPQIAEELLIELYENKRFSRVDAIELVARTHIERGGTESCSSPTLIVKEALRRFRKVGVAKSIMKGYWFIESLDAVDDDDDLDDWDDNMEDIAETENLNTDCDNVIGFGSGCVYVYYYPIYKERAESNGESTYPCKVGRSFNAASGRVRSQVTAMPESPEIGLVIKTDNPVMLEKAIQAVLGMRGKHQSDAPGAEWYSTNPTEVQQIYKTITTVEC